MFVESKEMQEDFNKLVVTLTTILSALKYRTLLGFSDIFEHIRIYHFQLLNKNGNNFTTTS